MSENQDKSTESQDTHQDASHDAVGHVHGPGCSHHHHSHDPFVRQQPKVGRNDPCFCGSGQKAKKCCLK